MTYEHFWQSLTSLYDAGEAKAVARMVLDVRFGLSLADILCGKDTQLSPKEQAEWQEIQQRLLSGEPVQYVLGLADFGPRQFEVTPSVLIPRPETYELCQWCLSASPSDWRGSILDIGTGSGCIACTLAAERPEASVTGWDISPMALDVARKNAKRANVLVSFCRQDALNPPADAAQWNLIVSNPPYICEHEQADMASWVLDHEPAQALFVPDNDPLLFYRAIAKYAQKALKKGGRLYFEINPYYVLPIEETLREQGFRDIVTRKDQFGKNRFVRASWE